MADHLTALGAVLLLAILAGAGQSRAGDEIFGKIGSAGSRRRASGPIRRGRNGS